MLVVEDNRETLFVYEKYLKGTGFQVLPARTLRAARALLQEVRPVAVILDVLLEGENSWDWLAELKRQPATRDIPVWVVTVVDNRAKALALGADDFCPKPVDRNWVVGRLQALVRPGGRGKVLVVDDDEVLRQLVCLTLAEDGFEAAGAGDTATALQVVVATPPSVILLDLQLGAELGEDFVRRYRALPGPHAPIIVFTANGAHAAAAEMARLGTAGALGKPFDLEQLATLVAELTRTPN